MRAKLRCQDCGQKYVAQLGAIARILPCERCGWPVRVPRAEPARGDEARRRLATAGA